MLTAELKFLVGDAAGLWEPLPHYYTVYSADRIEAIFSLFWTNIILVITI